MAAFIGYTNNPDEASMYKVIAPSQTTAQISNVSTGVQGDYIDTITVVPNSSEAQGFTLYDGTTAVMVVPVWAGGTGNPSPFTLHIGARCDVRWNITTGTSVSLIVVGKWQ